MDALNQEKAETAEKPVEGDKPKTKVKPKDLKHAAEMLGVEVKDLYDLEVSYGDDKQGAKKRKLGELKDLAAEQDDFTVRTLKFDEDVRKREAEFTRAEQMLKSLIQALPESARTPENLQKVTAHFQEQFNVERQRTMEKIPEWQDAQVREADLKGMIEVLNDYGIPETYLMTNLDHRIVRMVRDFWKQTTAFRKALGEVTERKPASVSRSGTVTKKAPKQQAIGDHYTRKVNALLEQISSGR